MRTSWLGYLGVFAIAGCGAAAPLSTVHTPAALGVDAFDEHASEISIENEDKSQLPASSAEELRTALTAKLNETAKANRGAAARYRVGFVNDVTVSGGTLAVAFIPLFGYLIVLAGNMTTATCKTHVNLDVDVGGRRYHAEGDETGDIDAQSQNPPCFEKAFQKALEHLKTNDAKHDATRAAQP